MLDDVHFRMKRACLPSRPDGSKGRPITNPCMFHFFINAFMSNLDGELEESGIMLEEKVMAQPMVDGDISKAAKFVNFFKTVIDAL